MLKSKWFILSIDMCQFMVITQRDRALFEAGIKLGALYHQFVGTPVNMETVESLEDTISKSIFVQPYADDISVRIDRDMVTSRLNEKFGLSPDVDYRCDRTIKRRFKWLLLIY
jgi:hypothetical protein